MELNHVLITGGAGFLGSHLVDSLVSNGIKVTVIDNLSSGSISNVKHHFGKDNFRFIKADLLKTTEWLRVFQGVDVVFHFAANPEVRHSTREPLDHYHQNLTATMNILEASRTRDVSLFVFASSSTVYGDPQKIPTPENHPLKPISIYGATKAAGEILLQTYSRLYGLKSLVLRYANIIGPRLTHGVIYDFVKKLKHDNRRLEILGDGTQRKSYLHVGDAIEATLTATQHVLRNNLGQLTYNVGNTDWITVKQIADAVVEAMGLQDVEYTFSPATSDGRGWPGDVKLMLLDITRITRETGWQPRLSSLEAVHETAKLLANLERIHENAKQQLQVV